MSNIEEFDHLVVKKAFEVQEINRIDNLLNTIPIPKITSDIPNKQSSKPPQLSPDDKDDMSSDEDELDRKVGIYCFIFLNIMFQIQSGIIEQEQPENPDVESTLYMEGGKVNIFHFFDRLIAYQAHHTHARKKIEASQLPKKAQRQNLKDTGDSSDEEFLKKLAQDDDEDDMAELFKGFVGPKKVQQTSNTSKRYFPEINSSW